MAPPKRKTTATETTATNDPVNEAPPPPPVRRSTRVSTRQLQNSSDDGKSVPPPPPPSKKAKVTKKKPEKKVSFIEEVSETTAKKDETTMSAIDEVAEGPTVVIEHCKQCSRFKTRALQVQKGLEEGVPGITVQINPEKPRRGCFEIRLKDGETFISLQDLKRPFKRLTDLVMEEVITDIIGKINA